MSARFRFASLVICVVVSCVAVDLSATPPPLNPRDNPESFERILLPLFVEPVRGAFGSEFHVDLNVVNPAAYPLRIFGIRKRSTNFPGYDPATYPLTLEPEFDQLLPREIMREGDPGRFIFVFNGSADEAAMSLRAYDVSRSAVNYGTELPIVRMREFTAGDIILPNIPVTTLFRNTLRIYALVPVTVTVIFFGPVPPASPPASWPDPLTLTLRAGLNIFEPAFASTNEFPVFNSVNAPQVGNVLITQHPEKFECPGCPPSEKPVFPIWAFVSVTNNETQHITTVTPQR